MTPKVEYVDTPFGAMWREWRHWLPPSGRMIAQWKRDRFGKVWYAVYVAG